MKKLFKLYAVHLVVCTFLMPSLNFTHAAGLDDSFGGSEWDDPAFVKAAIALADQVEMEMGRGDPAASVGSASSQSSASIVIEDEDEDDDDDDDDDDDGIQLAMVPPVPAIHAAGAPAIQAVIIPAPVVIPPYVQARIDAHAGAFPFAARGRPLIANIQKAWIRHWSDFLPAVPGLTHAQRQYPLMRLMYEISAVPSFGWTFEGREAVESGCSCQMCGKKDIHDVFYLRNPQMIVPGMATLRVGNTCAFYMQMTLPQLRDVARDNERPLE